jgi:alkanesulfonate monooxygenase SsuD/methylene tetrahydromethanopterin reductase-like flavin-dependent oxidoreductase (luciferase family)
MEHKAYGIPFYSTGERLRRLAEACEVIKRMWTETAPDFDGQYYQLKQAYCEPKPVQKPYPPFVIGGSGEKVTLRIAAQYADIWNYVGGSVETFQHKNEVLDGHCAALGRDPKTIERSVQFQVTTPDNLAPLRDTIRNFIKAGATHLILGLRYPYPEGIVQRLAEEVAEPLTGEFSG